MALGCVSSVPLEYFSLSFIDLALKTVFHRVLAVPSIAVLELFLGSLELAYVSSSSAAMTIPTVPVTDPKIRDEGLEPLPVLGGHREGGVVAAEKRVAKRCNANGGQSKEEEDVVFVPVNSLAPGRRVLKGQCEVAHVEYAMRQ